MKRLVWMSSVLLFLTAVSVVHSYICPHWQVPSHLKNSDITFLSGGFQCCLHTFMDTMTAVIFFDILLEPRVGSLVPKDPAPSWPCYSKLSTLRAGQRLGTHPFCEGLWIFFNGKKRPIKLLEIVKLLKHLPLTPKHLKTHHANTMPYMPFPR